MQLMMYIFHSFRHHSKRKVQYSCGLPEVELRETRAYISSMGQENISEQVPNEIKNNELIQKRNINEKN